MTGCSASWWRTGCSTLRNILIKFIVCILRVLLYYYYKIIFHLFMSYLYSSPIYTCFPLSFPDAPSKKGLLFFFFFFFPFFFTVICTQHGQPASWKFIIYIYMLYYVYILHESEYNMGRYFKSSCKYFHKSKASANAIQSWEWNIISYCTTSVINYFIVHVGFFFFFK